jgi:DNA-binding transcriptional LysR family regulator
MNVFCQVVESGGYQLASEVLFVTPSALSQTISNLEHSLGLALFERRGRRLVPTKDGLRLHREFRRHQVGFFQALNEMTGQQTVVSGTLRVGAYLEFAKSKLTRMLKEFIQEYPHANIKMVFDSPSRLHRLLHQGQLDLCLSIFPSAEKKTVHSKVLCEQELVLVSTAHGLSDSPSCEEILKTPIIDYYFNHQPIGRWLALHYNKRPKKIPVRIFAATAEMVVALVKEGAGIGVVPKYLVSTPEAMKGLKIVRPTAKKLNDYIWLLESAVSEKTPLHSVFCKKLYSTSTILPT